MPDYYSKWTGAEIDDGIEKARTTCSLNGLAAPIPMTDGYYIKLNGATATVDTPTAQGGTPTRYGVVPCSEGDIFTVNATGGSAPRAWGFVAADGTVLSVAAANADVNGLVLTAPANAAYFVVNDTSFTKTSYVGTVTSDNFAQTVMVRRQLNSPTDLNDITQNGVYLCPSGNRPVNMPVASEPGVLTVVTIGTITRQSFASANYALARTGVNGTWGAWERSDFGARSRLTASDDLDAVVKSGIYEYVGTSVPAHAPIASGGVVIVFTMPISAGYTAQVYFGQDRFASRLKIGSGWTNWKQILYDAQSGGISELPVLTLTGDTSTMSKDNAVTLDYSLFGMTGSCTCKWQGSSSQRYPKKNYTLKFDQGFDGWYQWATFVNAQRAANGNISRIPTTSRWGTQTKYCTKANWVDASAARNIVCARLWGEIVAGRVSAGDVTDYRADAPNYGAIDGFPVEIRINGNSVGLYTLNIPKDGWQFAMGSGSAEYLVAGEDNASQACRWKALAELDGTDFSVEYASEGAEDATIKASLNAAIQAAINAGSDWETTLAPYLDIDSVFDYFIFTCCVNNHDALARNILYGTYDGVKWFMSAYDLDTTFGVDPYGTSWFDVVNDRNQFAEAAAMHRLAYLAYTYSRDKLAARYKTLREGVLSDEHVWNVLSNFVVDIPSRDYDLDRDIWPNTPGTETANMAQYMDYYRMHCAYLDEELLGGGESGGGTGDYDELTNKPQIEGVTLSGNKTAADLGLVAADDYNPATKTSAMTQPVGKDASGMLWTEPAGSGSDDDKADVILVSKAGNPVLFDDGAEAPFAALAVSIRPAQAGSGAPSLNNVRTISGWTGANVTISPTTDAQDGETTAISWRTEAGTVYGGTLNVLTGLLTVEYASYPLSSFEWGKSSSYSNVFATTGDIPSDWPAAVSTGTVLIDAMSDVFTAKTYNELRAAGADNVMSYRVAGTGKQGLSIRSSALADIYSDFTSEALQQALTGHVVVYRMKTPVTYQLTPHALSSLPGNNCISADCGPVSLTYRADTKSYIDTPGSVTVNQATGDDLTGAPYKSIDAAVKSGANRITLAADYYGSFTLDRPVIFDGDGHTVYGDVTLTTESYGSIVRAAYAADELITACFVDQTTALTEEVSGSSRKGPKYNIACYSDDQKLLPVATVALCEATENSFTWADGYFYLNASGTRYSYVTETTCYVSADCTITELNVRHFMGSLLQITNGSVEIVNGSCIGSVNNSCILGTSCDMELRNVETALCWNDGINIHTTGNAVLYDCYCHDCSDDGVSHHDATTGAVYGGEFCRCGKGGIASPVNASQVDIYGAYCHDNDYGIYATASASAPQTYNVFGCVLKSNRVGIMNAYHTVRLYGNTITANETNISNQLGGTVIELDAPYPVSSVNGKTGAVVLDASDVGAYEKPASGIPKTDLASAVQTSLGKADTALQEHQSLSGKLDVPAVVTQSAPASLTLADNTEYYLTNVTSLTLTYPNATHWECWLKLTTASSGTISITLPASTYIGSAPTIGEGETWELSIRDGVVVAGKAAS